METLDLFKFRFVDRINEQRVFNNFFENKTEMTLWIKGNSGYGKTTFFNKAYDKWKGRYHLCYINLENDSTVAKILQDFIFELEKNYDIDFISMIQREYKRFYNTIYKKGKELTKYSVSNINEIISIILDTTYTVITLHDRQINPQEMIVKYIDKILEKKKICICIDNFSRCTIEMAELFFFFFKHFYQDDRFRGCIITTSEDMYEELQNAICQNLICKQIEIKGLDGYKYFSQIMESKFRLNDFKIEDIEYLYKRCEGSPKKLSTVISKLLEKGGISIYKNKKAVINKDKLLSILQTDHIQFNKKDFTMARQWIIYTYLCLNEKVDATLLENVALYIANKIRLFRVYDRVRFYQELEKLVDNQILHLNLVDNIISPQHDIDYRELTNIFDHSGYKQLFSRYTYDFIKDKKDIQEKQKLICKLSRNAEIDGWERINFRYGKDLAKNRQYYDAQNVFNNLNNCFDKLPIMKKMFIAINSYNTGNYNTSINQFERIEFKELHFVKAQYYYLFFLGKSYNNIGQTSKAVKLLEEALNLVQEDSREYVQTLNMLHMYYYEVRGKGALSKKFFDKIRKDYKEKFPDIWANTMRGCHNFLSYSEGLELLKDAENILEDDLEIAYLQTTKGFLYVTNNRFGDAKNIFLQAYKTIKMLRIHEYSYAANNYAVCCMLDSHYLEAEDVLQEALMWNKTEYGKIVLWVHLMICYVYLHQDQEAEKYYNYLSDYMERTSNADGIMKRKVYINLAVVARHFKWTEQSQKFFDKCERIVKDTTSEWRYNVLTGRKNCSEESPESKCFKTLLFDPWFLVYAHD